MDGLGTGDEAMRLGLTGRLDTLQAAILLVKLDVFEAELARRSEIAGRYGAELADVAAVPTVPAGYRSAFAIYTIRFADRDGVKAALEAEGIGSGLFYRLALHQHPAFKDANLRPLPVSERLANEVLSLPLHPDLDDEEVGRVIAAVRSAVAR